MSKRRIYESFKPYANILSKKLHKRYIMAEKVVGYQALCEIYNLGVIPHYRKSYISPSSRSSERHDNISEIHVYPNTYAVKDFSNPFCHIEFALKYDGVNLEILRGVFKKLEINQIKEYIQKHPTSKYTRIIWFLYEFLLDKHLDISIKSNVRYVNVLDPEHYFVANGIRSIRHRVNNNLLGNKSFCPIIRKTKLLNTYVAKNYDAHAKALTEKYDPQTITRASYYLFTKETLSSYKIEREQPSKDRVSRFITVLQQSPSIEKLSKHQLIELQNIIVDPRFIDLDYRLNQNYVGETINYQQRLHYISPRPEDVDELMLGLIFTLERSCSSKINAVVTAAMIAFGFVFIHPFEDGNGRIHRFLIHYILSRLQFTPAGIIFPISVVMLQKIHEYDRILETFSKPLMQLITNYDLSNDGALTVTQDTQSFYRYIDYTKFAEYLFGCIAETLHEHFENELEFLVKYDITKSQMQEIVDMPDKLIDLFIKFACQNHGFVSEQKREKYFERLTNEEISALQEVIKLNMLDLSINY